MSTDRKILIVVILLGLGLWAWASDSYHRLNTEHLQAIADHQATILEAAQWKKAAAQSAEGIALPSLVDEVQAADEAETDIAFVVSSKTEASDVMIPLPPQLCPPVVPVVAGEELLLDEVGSTTRLDFFALKVAPSIEMRADLDATGNLFYTGKILVHLSAPDLNFHSFTEHRLLDAQIGLGVKVQKALKYYYERPPRFTLRLRQLRHARFGWSAGVGVLARPTGELTGGVAVLWGVQF